MYAKLVFGEVPGGGLYGGGHSGAEQKWKLIDLRKTKEKKKSKGKSIAVVDHEAYVHLVWNCAKCVSKNQYNDYKASKAFKRSKRSNH